jgi:16S rRNA (uracil1498-N3)-methyltransferase
MHRFFLPPERCQDRKLVLQGAEAHHAARVLRLEAGDAAVVLDGAGKSYHCRVTTCTKSSVVLEIQSTLSQPAPVGRICLIAAIPKGQLFDEIVEQATELGVSEIVPLIAERGIVRLAGQEALSKQEKWQTTAREAMKQSGNLWAPAIQVPATFASILSQELVPDLSLVGSLAAGADEVRGVLAKYQERSGVSPRSIQIWVGPEGDFTPDELQKLAERGVCPITLGPWTLRCPTAVVSVVAILAHELRCCADPRFAPRQS